METRILKILHELESKYAIKIILAAHTGGRQVGIFHQNSDIDLSVLFIPNDADKDIENDIHINSSDTDVVARNLIDQLSYYRSIYLEVSAHKQVPISSINRAYRPFVYIKAPQLLHNSFIEGSLKYFQQLFHPQIPLLFYRDKADFNYKQAFLDGGSEKVNVRSYLFFMRSVLSLKWMMDKNDIPPTTIQELVHICETEEITEYVTTIIDQYIDSKDRTLTTPLNDQINVYMGEILDRSNDPQAMNMNRSAFEPEVLDAIISVAEAV